MVIWRLKSWPVAGIPSGLLCSRAAEEGGVVAQGSLHGAGGLWLGALLGAEGPAVCVVAVGKVGVEGGLPDHAGAGHVQRGEDALLHEIREGFAGDGFDDELGEVDAFAGVGVAGAGVELDVELVIVFKVAPFEKAGGVAKEDAQGEALPAGPPRKVGVMGVFGERLGQVLRDGLVEVECFVADEAHDQNGEGGLAERVRGHDGVGCKGQVVFGVAETVGLELGDAAIVEDGHVGSGDVSGLHEPVHGGVDLGGWDRSAVGARDGSRRGEDRGARTVAKQRRVLGMARMFDRLVWICIWGEIRRGGPGCSSVAPKTGSGSW